MVRCDCVRRMAAASPANPAPIICTVPGLDERMPQRDPYQLGLVDVHRLARGRPAARYHVLQLLAIDEAHDPGSADAASRAPGHDLICLCEMSSRTLRKKGARRPEPRVGNGRLGNNCVDPGLMERFTRNIKASNPGIFVDIT